MESSLNASKDVATGVTGIPLTCGPEPVMDAVCTAVIGPACSCVLEARSDREIFLRKLRWRHTTVILRKKMMTASCTLIIFVE